MSLWAGEFFKGWEACKGVEPFSGPHEEWEQKIAWEGCSSWKGYEIRPQRADVEAL